MPPDRDAEDPDEVGCRMNINQTRLECTILRLLASQVSFKTSHFIIPREQPMELLNLRIIFSLLRKNIQAPEVTIYEDETLVVEAFQRAFERMFYILQDEQAFDAQAYDENNDGYVAWAEFYRVYKRRRITVHLSIFERLYLTFDNPDSSILAQIVSVVVLVTIILSSLCFIVNTLPSCQADQGNCEILTAVESLCLFVFVVEYCVRVFTVWAVRTEVHDRDKLQELVIGHDPVHLPSAFMRLVRFLRAPANLIDLAAILPGVLGLMVQGDGGSFVVLRLVRLTRIFRAFKSPALVAPVIVISRTVQKSTKALYVLAFNLCLGIVIFGSLMYMAEGGEDLNTFNIGGRWNDTAKVYERRVGRSWTGQDWVDVWKASPFQSIPHSFWWAIVTATTVGYGDEYPTTTLGYIIGTATMVFSMVILALPVGVMGGTFSQEWDSYQLEKKEKAEVVEREMAFITRAIKKLDPIRLAPLVLVEVWHSHPGLRGPADERPPAVTFLGKAIFSIETPPDRQVSKEMRIALEGDPSVIKRSVTGSVRVRYEWEPGQLDTVKLGGTNGHTQIPRGHSNHSNSNHPDEVVEDFNIKGKLRVTVVSADTLINLDCNGSLVNPYCTVMCFPSYLRSKGGPQPYVWRTPTVRNKLNPQWNASHIFNFSWVPDKVYPKRRSPQSSPAAGAGKKSSKTRQLDQALHLLFDAATELKEQRGSLRQVRDDVRIVAGRVDQLTAVHNASAAAVHMT